MIEPARDQVVISVNPQAGRKSSANRADELARLLRACGFGVEVLGDLGRVAERAGRLHGEGRLRVVVGVGGDGTAAELANRLHPGVPITLLPAGTSNLLARCLRWGRSVERVTETIRQGRTMHLDVGRAAGRVFLLMASCGFDAEVTRLVHLRRQRNRRGGHIGYLSYVKPILDCMRSYRYPEIRVEILEDAAGRALGSVSGRWVFAFNLPRYGWGLRIAPEASATDGVLELCTFRGGSFWQGLLYAAAVQCGGWHRRLRDFRLEQVRRIRVFASQPVPYQLDGDPAGWLPVEVDVLPGRVAVMVPAGSVC
ncbi:MAG TPA: hypothetical protein EYP56_04145 [Planctomycetaceae bacterium]|nr:hypothetical protein [Planctomycetaceae bacterium]